MSGSQWVRMVMPRWPVPPAAPLILLLLGAAGGINAYFADWGVIGGRPQEPTCVDIPKDMPLCSGIDYTKMRLPNLLQHDTLKEAQQQAGYWVPLLNLRCHLNTQLFLCSLFTPVCLESPIYPCRSLCEAVRDGCESRMQTYSFPWPDMLSCDKFPLDNDMCITVQHARDPGPERVQDVEECEACSPVETYENIVDNYCRADVVVKTRVKKQRRRQLVVNRSRRVYKHRLLQEERRPARRLKFSLSEEATCCSLAPSRKPYLIMGRRHQSVFIPTFVMHLKKSKPLRKALKMFRHGLNCSDPNLITNNLEPTSLSQEPRESGGQASGGSAKVRRKSCQKKCRKNCGKRCRRNRGTNCGDECSKKCRRNCRQKSRSRNKNSGPRRPSHTSSSNRAPSQDALPPTDITSEINFTPSEIERPPLNQENADELEEDRPPVHQD